MTVTVVKLISNTVLIVCVSKTKEDRRRKCRVLKYSSNVLILNIYVSNSTLSEAFRRAVSK